MGTPAVSEETTTTTTTGGTTTKPVFKPTVEVKVKAVTVFDEPLTEEAQESVKEVFCEEVQETVAGEYTDCDECTIVCSIAEVTRRRRLLAVSYELSADVNIPTSIASTEDAADTFGSTFQEAMQTAITTSPVVVEANGGVAPTVTVEEVEVTEITTTTTTTTTTNEKGTTTDAYEFSSAPAVSCLLAVLVPVLL